jgi:hypothetical protein
MLAFEFAQQPGDVGGGAFQIVGAGFAGQEGQEERVLVPALPVQRGASTKCRPCSRPIGDLRTRSWPTSQLACLVQQVATTWRMHHLAPVRRGAALIQPKGWSCSVSTSLSSEKVMQCRSGMVCWRAACKRPSCQRI